MIRTATGGELSSRLSACQAFCPVYIADKTYYLPTREEVKSAILESFINRYPYAPETFDCDDFALILHAWVRQRQYRLKQDFPWAFGQTWGTFSHVRGSHVCNIAITPEAVLIVEPQNDTIRDLLPDDHPAFIML